jgi:hypothetical protein
MRLQKLRVQPRKFSAARGCADRDSMISFNLSGKVNPRQGMRRWKELPD